MADLGDIRARIDGRRLEELLTRSVKAYSPCLAEAPATRVFAEALERAGIPYTSQPVPGPDDSPQEGGLDTRANLIVELGPEPASLLWVGHVDTIPLWHDEEHRVRREGDLLHGLGTADMKGGCAAIVEALVAMKEAGAVPKRGLRVALVVGEEELGDGSEALVGRAWAPLTVIGEPTGLSMCIDHHGYLEYRLEVEGARAHAALPEVGANAIHAMLGWLNDVFARLGALPYGELAAVNLREIRGGTNLFVTADRCEALLDVHVPPGLGPDAVERILCDSRDAVPREERFRLDHEQVFWAPGYATDPDDPRLLPLRGALSALGRPWEPAAFRSHSDASILHAAGTLPVICGPGRLEVAHTRREHVSLSEVEQAAHLYAAMIHAACVA